jgi:hypothetical protein
VKSNSRSWGRVRSGAIGETTWIRISTHAGRPTRCQSNMKHARSVWPLLTIFDLFQVNSREQVVTKLQVAYRVR